ncbi:metallophosphoesterase [Streptomyces sp. XD-27]|uniref:metallophosphoesterase n=1 Tax=Streptomyces sp. XD-27 TaxID=3062779 RepID=UPI0026F40F8A|nr:metallophosphoesterase [Streptomyces sp. XD-27]WKX70836.1 metallophosphoesterase [Streptomyces sp. XD-27]
MVAVFVLIALAVVGLLAGVHWYLWRRLVHDTTAPGGRARRAGTAAAVLLPLVSVAALVSGRAGAPFAVQRVLAWPGYLWLALVLYLTLALLVGEAVRPLLLRFLPSARADRSGAEPRPADPPTAGGNPGPKAEPGPKPEPGPKAEPEPKADPGPKAEPGPHAEPEPEADPGPKPEPGPKADPEPDAEPEPDTEPGPKAHPAASRRLFVSRAVALGAGAVAAGTVGYGAYTVLSGPRLKRITVPLARLPRQAHGFRIAVVSDIHLGPILGRAHTRRIVDTINRTGPDLIAVVGDLVDGSVEDLGPAAEPLRELRARHGAYFVTGNHEYFSGARQWIDHVRELGLRPLENARAELPGFDLAGVNDIAGERDGQGPDHARALGDRDPGRASVLLAHQPVVIHESVRHGVDLQLSGHTHGGQLWPGNYIAELANPTVAGLERYGDTQLYVTRGAGAWGPPVRVGAPPDVTVVELAATRA